MRPVREGSQALRLSAGRCSTWSSKRGGRMRKWSLRLVVALVCVAGLAVASAGAGGSASLAGPVGGAGNETATKWFVELSSPPSVKGTSKDRLKSERDAFTKNAAAAGVQVTERFAFDTLWNGVSVSVPSSQVAALR